MARKNADALAKLAELKTAIEAIDCDNQGDREARNDALGWLDLARIALEDIEAPDDDA